MKSIPAADLPHLTTDQMVEVDRLMIEEWQISLVQMMENLLLKTIRNQMSQKLLLLLLRTGQKDLKTVNKL